MTNLSAGVHTFSATLKTAGSQSLTATDAATSSITGTQSGITVSPAAVDHFAVSAPSSVTAGTAFNVTVTAQDVYGNTVTGYQGKVHFTSSDPGAVLPSNYTYKASDKGVHTFSVRLKTKGSQTVTVTDQSNSSITGTATVSVS